MVSYDLIKSKDYERMEATIKGAFKHYARVLLSQWFVQSDQSATAVFNAVAPGADSDDRLLVTECTQGMVWHNTRLTDETMRKWQDVSRP